MYYREDNRGVEYTLNKQQRKILIAIFHSKDEMIHQHTLDSIQRMLDSGVYYETDATLLNALVEYYKLT